jgi:hypothetical protein
MSMPTQSQPTSIRRPGRKKFWFTFITVASVLTFLYAVALIQIDLSVQLQQNALRMLERPEQVAARRGLPLEDVAPAAMLRARAEANA